MCYGAMAWAGNLVFTNDRSVFIWNHFIKQIMHMLGESVVSKKLVLTLAKLYIQIQNTLGFQRFVCF